MASTTSNNNLNASIPIFMDSDFKIWEQKMRDFLKSQHLCRITNGDSVCPPSATPNAPTLAEALAQAAWDENSEQVQGIIGSPI